MSYAGLDLKNISLDEAMKKARSHGVSVGSVKNRWNQEQGVDTSLTGRYEKMEAEAKESNKARETEIRGLYGSILNGLTGSENSLRASGLKDIETQSNKLVGNETQNLISSGLFGTTTAASVPTRVASEFTEPSRLKLEDMLSQRKTEAQLGLAGFVERIQNPYPDYNNLVQAQIAQASTQQQQPQPQPVATKPHKSLSEWLRTDFGGY